MSTTPLRLLEGTGIELEYVIVDARTLDVLPACDRLMEAVAGEPVAELERGPIAWSNELALHVLELKTNGPVATLAGLASAFQADIVDADDRLRELGARLLPGPMHPWMDPLRETRLWPHEYGPVYAAFDRIFSCRGHGWSNLQSCHVNLSFADDAELGRLHAAARLVLPLLPALAAGSPIADGRVTGHLDTRLHHYRRNARRVPSVTGHVVPEPAWTRSEYESVILDRIYRDLAPLDPDGVLRHEWVNARGAIVRFDRMALEIRLLDVQECCRSDLAIAALVRAAIRALVEERWSPLAEQQAQGTEELGALLARCIDAADATPVTDPAMLRQLGWTTPGPAPAGDVWRRLAEELLRDGEALPAELGPALDVVLHEGPLARRILEATGPAPTRGALRETWARLADCLREGTPFRARG